MDVTMIIMGLTGLLLTVLGIYMNVTGRGAFIVAEHKNMSRIVKESFDRETICKIIGKFFILTGLLAVLASFFG